jgi:hypothetical protein
VKWLERRRQDAVLKKAGSYPSHDELVAEAGQLAGEYLRNHYFPSLGNRIRTWHGAGKEELDWFEKEESHLISHLQETQFVAKVEQRAFELALESACRRIGYRNPYLRKRLAYDLQGWAVRYKQLTGVGNTRLAGDPILSRIEETFSLLLIDDKQGRIFLKHFARTHGRVYDELGQHFILATSTSAFAKNHQLWLSTKSKKQ